MKEISIFDLDGTIIDSSHRHVSLPDGSVDLAHWFENATPQKIAKDTLLPLIGIMRNHYRHRTVIICTARMMKRADFIFLRNNDVPFHYILFRPKGNMQPDGELKKQQILALLDRLKAPIKACELYDDNASVLACLSKVGMRCHDAKALNARY